MRERPVYLVVLCISVLVSCFDATVVTPHGYATDWQQLIGFPANFLAYLILFFFFPGWPQPTPLWEFVLTLPFNFLWFSGWAYFVNVFVAKYLK